MLRITKKNTALVLIDIQTGLDDGAFYGGNRNNPFAEENMARILQRWRAAKGLVFHVQHSSTNPESPLHPSKSGFRLKDGFHPLLGEPLFVKQVNSAFIGTDLEETLRNQGITTLIVVGLTTNHCISTSVRMAGNLGFKTYLIADATATFDRIGINGEQWDAETIHQTTLASLKDEFATIVFTKALLEAIQ
ncbi:MAG: cysteine hydrolase family protein [Bacteroidota bacterium]